MALTSSSAAFQLGQTHGQILGSKSSDTYGIFGQTKPPAKPPAKPKAKAPAAPAKTVKPPPSLYEQAQRIAQAQTAAQIAAIRQQQDLYNQQGQDRAAQIAAASQAAAKYFSGIGDLTANTYQQAAQNIAGLASGFSGQLGQEATADAGKVAANLAALGAPAEGAKTATGQTVQPQALQNVLYGLGGFLPGNLLATLGPLQAQQARDLPNQLLSYGQQQAAGTLSASQNQADTLTSQILNAQAGTPDLARSILGTLSTQTKPQIFGSGTGGYYALTPDGKIQQVIAGTGTKGSAPKVFGGAKTGYFTIDPATGKVTKVVGGIAGTAAGAKATHLQSKTINGHTVTFDPATGTYYQPGTNLQVDPNTLSKPAPKVSVKALADARSYLQQARSGFYSSQVDPTKPLSSGAIAAAAKAAHLTVAQFLDPNDPGAQQQRANAGIGWNQVEPNEPGHIQDLYLTLVRRYGIPARQAFDLVAGQYRQWGAARRASYFPKADAAQGAAYTGRQQLGAPQLAALWIQAGGDPRQASTAAAVALAESRGWSDALNDNPGTKDYSVSPWQINYYGDLAPARTRRFGTPEQLRADPLLAAKAAVAISKNGRDFSPWTTYTSGKYRSYLS